MIGKSLNDNRKTGFVSGNKITGRTNDAACMASSVLLATAWVTHYGYQYNIDLFNTRGINIWAFTLWIAGGYGTLRLYHILKSKLGNAWMLLSAYWLIYIAGMLAVEYTGYQVLHIRECSSRSGDALMLGLVHGSYLLHIYYVLFPLLALTVHKVMMHLIEQWRRSGTRTEHTLHDMRQRTV